MKGAVFIALNDMVERTHGLDVWEQALTEVQPKSGGIYTSTLDYDDAEIVALVVSLSGLLNVEASQLTRLFGTELFAELNGKYPIFSKVSPNLYSFLNSIETVIHKEVRKLYDNPSLPNLQCDKFTENHLQLVYKSPRKLCYLAEGLVFGAADYYGEKIEIRQTQCMHKHDEQCVLDITINGK